MELTEEKKNLNFVLWTKKLQEYNCYSESLVEELGDKITHASYNLNEANGGCYEGSLVQVILNNLCTVAYHINELAFGVNANNKLNHPFLKVNMDMLLRVLLLQHISKALMFVLQTETWKKNKGYLFDFNGEKNTQLKVGEYSAYLCMKHGIQLSDVEFEAMTIIDKEDKSFNPYQDPLVVLVKAINQFVGIELQRKYDYLKKEE